MYNVEYVLKTMQFPMLFNISFPIAKEPRGKEPRGKKVMHYHV